MKRIFNLLLFVLSTQIIFAQNKNTTYIEYINKYQDIAIKQQKLHGIPASIILAQGLLESGAGKSTLATKANNHFGIKCHEWTGDAIYHNDDKDNECFRKYKEVSDSFEDHSQFLANRSRYQSLFLLKPTDYVAWAHGLKAAGYATDPAYAQKLINLIEIYDLHEYDKKKRHERKKLKDAKKTKSKSLVSEQNKTDKGRIIYKSNYIKIVIAQDGDTYVSLAEELNMSVKKLRRYNEVGEDKELKAGDIIYLSKKKKQAAYSNQIHVVRRRNFL